MADAVQRLAEVESERDRFRGQARILGEEKAEWLCEACEVIHPWRDGDRFTASCPDCGWPMVPTSVSARALAEARTRAREAEAKLAAIRQLAGSPAWLTPPEVQRKVLAIISEEGGHGQ